MERRITIRLGEAEAQHIKTEAVRLGITPVAFVRQSVWRDAAVAEIRDQTKAAVQQEFDLLFAKIAADFSSELKQQIDELREVQRNNFAKLGQGIAEQISKLKGA